jgi:hypothetical protein
MEWPGISWNIVDYSMLNNHLVYDAACDAAYNASYVAYKSLSGPTPLFYSIYRILLGCVTVRVGFSFSRTLTRPVRAGLFKTRTNPTRVK